MMTLITVLTILETQPSNKPLTKHSSFLLVFNLKLTPELKDNDQSFFPLEYSCNLIFHKYSPLTPKKPEVKTLLQQ